MSKTRDASTVDDLPSLTPAELDVMKVLWERGRLAAREIHEAVGEANGWSYSTTRTTVERLVKKGVLSKALFHGLHLYEPAISRARGLARLVRDFAHRVLDTPPVPVVSLFAESSSFSDDELDELRALLEEDDR